MKCVKVGEHIHRVNNMKAQNLIHLSGGMYTPKHLYKHQERDPFYLFSKGKKVYTDTCNDIECDICRGKNETD